MNFPRISRVFSFTVIWGTASACGPFFPDRILDKPQASLGVPPVSYIGELCRIAGIPCLRIGISSEVEQIEEEKAEGEDSEVETGFFTQVPLEVAELRQVWERASVDSAEIARRIDHYEKVRKSLLVGLDSTAPMSFPTFEGPSRNLPERPLGAEYPKEVADYVEGARLLSIGRKPEARALWQSILDQPLEQRRLRAVWAAWMMAKTSADEAECLVWYERIEKEATLGAADCIDLLGASMGWRALLTENNPVARIRLYFEAFKLGQHSAVLDLRRFSWELLTQGKPEDLATAAADPLVCRLIHLNLQATLDSAVTRNIQEKPVGAGALETQPPEAWLQAVKTHARLPLQDGARLAWALYAVGRFDEARGWLDVSPKDDFLSLWLLAKFDLRAGRMDAAQQHLASAIRLASSTAEWDPQHPWVEQRWYDAGAEIQSANQGRLLADAGIIALGRNEFTAALDHLRNGGYGEDAAYVAEHLLTTDELLKYVRKVAPRHSDKIPPPDRNLEEPTSLDPRGVDPATCLEPDNIGVYTWLRNSDNRLRYQLARRLARERRSAEALEFMPPTLTALFRHYTDLDRARVSGRFSGEALAAITWRQARIHRWWGAQLFSTDSTPDGGIFEWDFPSTEFIALRSFREGWSSPEDETAEPKTERAIPPVSKAEIKRANATRLPNRNRYHYRYVAADLAWKAAKLLPDNHPQLAALYRTVGKWVVARDSNAADRFYEALIKRCAGTEIGQAAIKRRWFPEDMESLGELPGMPAGLIPPVRAK